MSTVDFSMLEGEVIKAKGNDVKAKEYIINMFMPFILKTSNNTYINNMDKEDIKQELIISLMMAINKYKGNDSFFWYAIQTMKNNIYMLVKKYKRNEKNISIDSVVLFDNEELDKDMLNGEECNSLLKSLKKLKQSERDIIFKSFFLNYSYEKIMNETKLKYSTIACKKCNAIKKLRKSIDKY